MSQQKIGERCSNCGFRIRGPQHDEGQHHIVASRNRKDKGTRKEAPVGRK